MIVAAHVNRLRDDIGPHWDRLSGGKKSGYKIEVKGSPSFTCEIEPMGEDGDHNTAGITGTAMRVVNAIPVVCDAQPGVRLDPRPAALHGARADGRGRRARGLPLKARPAPTDEPLHGERAMQALAAAAIGLLVAASIAVGVRLLALHRRSGARARAAARR